MPGFPKAEHLCGKTSIDHLLKEGRWGSFGHYKYCRLANEENEVSRMMVSVPKKYFKRAVKRNLLKRRTREAYRLQKELMGVRKFDLLLFYNSPEVASFQQIREEVGEILKAL